MVIAAGGTGGHLMPALALAEALRPSATVVFVGTRRGMERSLVPAAGYTLHLIDVMPFAGSHGARRFLAPPMLVRATAQAAAIVRAERAQVVVGMGGYPSLPVVAAGRLLRRPVLIHEQNAIPGLANSVAARLTPHVALTFAEAAGGLPRGARPRVTGLPMRAGIESFDRGALAADAAAAFGLEPGRRTLLVTGGSQGAVRLNAAAAGTAERWRDRSDRQILLHAGAAHAEALAARLAALGGALVVRCVPFIERMDLAYAIADVAVCRAGAATVCELAATGLPAVLVPYPHGRAGEQTANARAIGAGGGAIVVPDAEASAERIAGEVDALLDDDPRRAAMSVAAVGFAKRGAAKALADWALDLAAAGTRDAGARR